MPEPVNKEMEKSVDDLIGDLQGAFVKPVEPAVPPVVEPPVVVVPPVVEPPVVPPVVEPPPAIPPVVHPVVPPEPHEPAAVVVPPVVTPVVTASPKDPRDSEMEQMRNTITELRKLVETAASHVAAPQPVVTPSAPPAPVKFVESEEDLDKVLNSADNFNAFLNTFISKAAEQVPKSTLDIGTIDKIVTQKLAVNEFYANNTDLAGNKSYVGLVANELSAANPTWTLEDIIKNLAPEVRTRLRMSGIAPPTPAAPGALPPEPPAFVPGGGVRPGSGGAQLTRVEAGIADLLEGANV